MALAVKKAKERREAEKEMERRAQQAKDEGIQMRRRLVEQQSVIGLLSRHLQYHLPTP